MNRTRGPVHGEIELLALVSELLDAHTDTVELATKPAEQIDWAAHLDYLRALRRRGNEILAGSDRPESVL